MVVQRAARWLKPPEEYEEKPKRKRRKKKKEDKEPERTTEDINKLADIVKKKTDYVTKSERGHGATEAIEYILKELY